MIQTILIPLVDTQVPEDRLLIKELGQAILSQAFEDITTGPKGCNSFYIPSAIESAKDFLGAPNSDLAFWCECAKIDMDAVVRRARQILKVN